MHKGETLFVNLRNGLNSKPNLIDIKEDINKYITTRDKDWYVSLYKYNEAHKKLLEEKGTLAGVKDTLTNTLYFDFFYKLHIVRLYDYTQLLLSHITIFVGRLLLVMSLSDCQAYSRS